MRNCKDANKTVGVVITHPTQFDVPVFRLGRSIFQVIYTDKHRIKNIFDPELERSVEWEEDNLSGYNYSILDRPLSLVQLWRSIAQGKFDLLITNGYSSLSYLVSIVAGKIYCRKNAIRIDTVSYNNASVSKRVVKFLWYKVLNLFITDYFVVGSLSKSFLMNKGIKSNRIRNYGYVTNNAFFKNSMIQTDEERSEFKRTLKIDVTKKVVLCISKHNPREAPIDTLRAFSLLHDSSLHLLIVGDGPDHEDLIILASALNISNITFTGYVNFQTLPQYYSIADVFIHDSHDEPWGVSVQESIACNIPVVASDRVGAGYDLIATGVNGYVFPAGDTEELCKCIRMAFSLDKEQLASFNQELLKRWDYSAVLENIQLAMNE